MIEKLSTSVQTLRPNTATRRYLALWFPFLPTDRLRRERRKTGAAQDEALLVTVEKRHNALTLAACDPLAMRLGLAPGLGLADVRAAYPSLEVEESDPAADAQTLAFLAGFCERFTPLVALDPPDGAMLDMTGCAHLFGGEKGLLDILDRRFKGWSIHLRRAIAGTPDAARALARFGEGGLCQPGEEEERTRHLPLTALEAPPETTLALSRAGFKTLGDLAARPSALLSARFGEDLSRRLRRILGYEDRRITPLRPLPECRVEQYFLEPLAHREGLEQALDDLAIEASRMLEQRGEGGRRFEISFYRADGAVRRIGVESGRPMRDAKALMRLIREKLDSLADPLDPGFGFDALRLAAPMREPLTAVQSALDGNVARDEAQADLIDRLAARFGRNRVVCFIAQDTHIPERAAHIAPAMDRHKTMAWPPPEASAPPTRPLLLFQPPQPIDVIAETPDGPPRRFHWRRAPHEIVKAEGPERIAPEWWRDGPDEPTRDYYRIEDQAGRRFWVFRNGLYENAAGAPRWFLHGLFA